jgi:hypothetical protein
MRALMRRPDRVGWLILSAAFLAAGVMIFWLERGLSYDGDSFNWMGLSGLGSNKALIEPYGGHLILLPLLIYKAVLNIAGVGYSAFAVPQILLILALGVLLYVYGRRRVGPLLALPAPIALVFLGSGWSVLLQPLIGIQFLVALVAGLAAWLALEREDRRGDIAGCVLLTIAAWSFEMGLAFVVGAAVGILLREDRWRRIWIVAVPIVTYAIWKAWAQKYGGFTTEPSNLIWLPAYAVDSLGVVGVSLFGQFFWVGGGMLTFQHFAGFDFSRLTQGLVFLIFEGIAVVLAVRWMRRRGPIPATLWVALAALITLWLEQTLALGPTRTPGEIRYVVPEAIFVLLLVVEVARGMKTTRMTLLVAALITVAAVIGNLARFNEGRDLLVLYSPNAKAAITVMELAGDNIEPTFSTASEAPGAFEPGREPYVSAGFVQRMDERFGNLGYSVPDLLKQGESPRRSADIVAAYGLELHAEPAGAAGASCKPKPGAADTVTLPPGGAILIADKPSELLARRFASNFVIGVGEVGPDEAVALEIPPDEAKQPWRVQAPDSGGLTACPLK